MQKFFFPTQQIHEEFSAFLDKFAVDSAVRIQNDKIYNKVYYPLGIHAWEVLQPQNTSKKLSVLEYFVYFDQALGLSIYWIQSNSD